MTPDRGAYTMIFMRVWESVFNPEVLLRETTGEDLSRMTYHVGQIADDINLEITKRFTECAWTFNSDDRSWNGTCGIKWCLTESGPEHNQMAFCPRCGRPLKEVKQ